MKKYFYLFVAAVASLAMVSCDKNKPEDEKKDNTAFTIEVSAVADTTATITVTPSKDNVAYLWDIVSAETAAELNNNADSIAAYVLEYYAEYYDAMVDYFGEEMLAQYGITSPYTMLEVYMGMIVSGVDTYDYEGLSPNTEYVVFAVAIDSACNITSNVATKSFKTTEMKKINFSVDITENDTAFFFVPSNENASYLMTFVDKDSLGSYTTATYWDAFIAYCQKQIDAYAAYGYDYTLQDFGYNTQLYLPKTELEEGHAYYLLAQAVYQNIFYSDLFVGEFSNAPAATVAPAPAHITNASMFSAKKEINNIQKKEFGHKRPNFVLK